MTVEVDAHDADPAGFEPLYRDGAKAGFITSGGYGHWVGKSLGLALVEPGSAAPGTAFETYIVGEKRPARVIASSPHDPTGARMRA